MNYFGKFDATVSDALGQHPGAHLYSEKVHAAHVPSDAIVVPDAHLLFGAEFKRSGVDLVLSGHGREYVVQDYFKGEKHAPLASPDGAHLTGDIVNALAGEVQIAQAGGTAGGGQVIGHVTKLVGNASATRNGVSIILNNGDNVEKGDVVQSGSDSTLGITFIDGTVFGLSSNARMVLNEMVYDPNGSNNSSLLSLVAGTITFVAGETAKHGDMKIDTPVATMGIRGTAVLFAVHFKLPNGSFAADDLNPPPDAEPEGAFQVLVEPDGTTGSYILFDKITLTPLTVVDRANVQWNISNGLLNQTTSPLSPEIQKLITDVFSLKFSDSTNIKSIEHFTDSIIPTPFGFVKFSLNNGPLQTFVFANALPQSSPPPSPNGANISHIAEAPFFTSIDPGKVTELSNTTGSSAIDKTTGIFNYFDVNVHDNATVSVSLASFAYKDAHGNNINAKLNALELADIKAVSDIKDIPNLLTVTQGGLDSVGNGTASWTYKIADGAFDFLAANETLTLTFNATVDNNYLPADQTGSGTFTITITGTNDVPKITSPQQNITFAPAGHDTSGGNLFPDTATNGTLVFTDPDLTDTHTPTVEMTSAVLNGQPLSEIVGTARYNAFADALTVKITTADDSTGTGTGQIEWTLADLEVYLADLVPDGEKLILTYTVTVTDSQGATSQQNIVVTIEGNQPAVTAWIDINPIPDGGAALWSDAANWESDKAPTAADDVFIGNDQVNPKTATFPVTVDAAAQAQSLSMNDFSDGNGIPTLHVNPGVTLAISGALNLNTSKATDPNTGNPLVLPTAQAIIDNYGTITVGGVAELLKSSVLNNYGSLVLSGGGDFVDQSSITNSGLIELKGATLNVAVDIHNSDAGIDGTVQVDNSTTLGLSDGATITKGNLNIAGGGTVDVEAGTTGPGATLDDVTVNGTDAASPAAASLIEIGKAGAAILVLENGTKIENGALKVFGGSTLDIESNAGATLDGVSVIGVSGVPESMIKIGAGSTLVLDDGTIVSDGKVTIAGDATLDVAAGTSGAGATLDNVTVSGGTVTVDPGVTLTLDTVTLDGVTLSGGTDAATAVTVSADSTIENATVTGDITTDPGVTLTLDTVTLDGVTLSGGTDAATAVTVSADSTIENATVTGDITTDPGVTLTLDTVTLDGVTLSGGTDAATAVTVSADSTIENATVTGDITTDPGVTLTLDTVTLDGVTLSGGTDAATAVTVSADSTIENATVTGDITTDLGVTLTLDTVTLDGVTLSGGTDAATAVTVSADSTIENATVTGDITTDPGVTLTLDTVTLDGVTLSGGTDAATAVTVSADSTIENATVTGDITTDPGVTLTLDTVTLDGVTLSGGEIDDVGSIAGFGTIGSVITGSGTLTASGGTLTLTGDDTYSGVTTITGTLALAGSGSIADSSGVGDNGTFDISGLTAGTSITTLSGTGKVLLGSNTLTLTAGAGIFSGVISGSGGLTADGTGTETLSGINAYGGTTTIGSGETLALSGSGSIAASSGVVDDGTFDIQATAGTSIKTLSGTGKVTLGAEILTLTTGAGIFSGVISGSGGLTVDGTGTETLSGINAYGGTTTIGSGETLALSGSGSIAASSGVVDDGTFDIQATAGTSIKTLSGTGKVTLGSNTLTISNASTTFSGTIGGTGGLTLLAGLLTLTGDSDYSGTTTISGTLALSDSGSIADSSNVIDNGTFDISGLTTSGTSITTLSGTGTVKLGSETLTLTKANNIFSGVISGSGSGGLTVDGTGTETLTGINTFGGATTIGSGETLALSGAGSIAKSSDVIDNGTFDITAKTSGVSIVTLSGTGKVTLGAETLTLSNASTTFSGAIDGSGGLTLTAGTEKLAGNNLYTGVTTINGGTLALSGTGSIAHSTDVIDDGTFDISATTSGASIVTLSGNGAVTLGAETLTLTNASTTFSGTISSTGGGITVSGGTLALGTLTLDDLTLAGNFSDSGTLTIVDNVTFNGVTLSGGTLDISGILDSNGTTTISGATVINSNHVDVISGTFTIDPTPFTNNGTFEVQSSAVFSGEVHNLPHNAVQIDQEVVTNTNGTIKIDAGGTLTLFDATINGGTIIDNGTLLLTGTTSKLENVTFSGTATLDISAHTALEIGGSVSSGVTVKFDASDGDSGLILDNPSDFHGVVQGLVEASHESDENYIDLKGFGYTNQTHVTSAVFNSSTDVTAVTITNGSKSLTIDLHGDYGKGDIEFASDQNGGTLFSDPAANSGAVTVDSGTTLDIAAASTATVTFANSTGTTGELVLADSKDFTGTIASFIGDGTVANSDLIDVTDVQIADVATSKTTYTDHGDGTGTLTLYNAQGQALDSVNFDGNYQLANFTIEDDGSGGTLIVDPPVNTNGQQPSSLAVATNQNSGGPAGTDGFVFNFDGFKHHPTGDSHPGQETIQQGGAVQAGLNPGPGDNPDHGHSNTPPANDGHDHFGLNGFVKAQLHASDFHFV